MTNVTASNDMCQHIYINMQCFGRFVYSLISLIVLILILVKRIAIGKYPIGQTPVFKEKKY